MIPNSLFAVPIWDDSYPDFDLIKDDFIAKLKTYIANKPLEVRSNVGGKHSSTLLHEEEEFKQFFEFIEFKLNAAAESVGISGRIRIMESWVNINDTPGAFNLQHIHGGVLSGVFYVQIPEGSGLLYLTNPAPINLWEGFNGGIDRSHYASETIEVQPIEGTFLVWPSYVPHTVGPNHSAVERISIAFNSTLKENHGNT